MKNSQKEVCLCAVVVAVIFALMKGFAMKNFEFITKALAIFGLAAMFAVSGWGACPAGTNMGTWNASAGSSYNNRTGYVQSDDADYYIITNPVGGQINLTVQNTPDTNNDLYAALYSDSECTTQVWTSGEMGDLQTISTTVNVTAGTTYYLYFLGSKSNEDTRYLLNANKPVKGHSIFHENPFSPVFPNGGLKLFGDFASTGDSVLCQNNGAGGCNNTYSGYLYETNLIYKNEAGMTLNSASSALILPANVGTNEIEWAGLYWQGHIADPNANNYATSSMIQNRGNVSFQLPDGTTQNLTADKVWHHDFWGDGTGTDGGFRSFYQGFKDVTSLVKSHLIGGTTQTFSVGNIKANSGTDWLSYFYLGEGAEYNNLKIGFWGNWSIIVVYKHNPATMPSGTKIKNINVFNGFDAMFPLPIDGYSTFNIEIPMSGFLTPNSGTVNAKMSFYASGGEKLIQRDAFYIQNANNSYNYETVSNAVNPANNPFNGSASSLGIPLDAAISYYPGFDLDIYDISNYMTNNQISTSLKLEATFSNSNGDQSTPGAIAFSTDLYTPVFCYDYGYEQNGLPFTEENNGTAMPYISGLLPNTADITVSLYIRNQEDSDVRAENVMLNINDINTSEAVYIRNSTQVTYPLNFTPTSNTDAAWPLNVSDAYIHNIPLGNIDGEQHAYAYYSLSPLNSGNINIPIKGTFSYDLIIPLLDNTILTLPYSSTIGGTGLQMCSADNFNYTPEWGIFSVVDAGLYDSSNINRYYDLTTQVTKRPANLKIASFDQAALDTPKAVTTIVAVELIDVSLFHDVDAACREPSSAVSPRIWITFENNVSQTNFNAATIQNAINEGMISDVITGGPSNITSAAEFFKTATPNAAYRVSFNVLADQNDSLITIEQTAQGIRIDNFSNVQQAYPYCRQYVTNPNNNNLTNSTSVACSNNGNNSTYRDVAICMECLYGTRTQVVCSRDNFAIRPESYTVQIRDVNQTNHAQVQLFAPNRTGVSSPVTDRVHTASGYDYRFDINATNHIDNQASPGYTRYFATGGSDYNISFVWEPSTLKTGCNDIADKPLSINLINGITAAEDRLGQVGEYRLNIIDKTWTAVDWDSTKQSHQIGSHFLSGSECTPNATDVPLLSSIISLSGTTINNRVGCDISSTHNNIENNLLYRDYTFEFHPFNFNVAGITPSVGLMHTAVGTNTYIYMADMSQDENMSFHLNGPIIAQGYNGTAAMSNFVGNCYAKALDINVTETNTSHTNSLGANLAYQMRFHDLNASGNIINALDINATKTLPVADARIQSGQNYFIKDLNGSMSTILNLNYSREVNSSANPKAVTVNSYKVNCTNAADCTFNADLVNNKTTQGEKDLNTTVRHYYGRTNAPKQVFIGNTGVVPIYYEVFCNGTGCDKTLLPNGITSVSNDDPRWFVNTSHIPSSDGVFGNITQKGTAGTVLATAATTTAPFTTTVTYDASRGYPYKTTMENNASSWLIYNRYNINDTNNEFDVEFQSGESGWTGLHDNNTNTAIGRGAIWTNKRLDW
jgi:hypothetical protein